MDAWNTIATSTAVVTHRAPCSCYHQIPLVATCKSKYACACSHFPMILASFANLKPVSLQGAALYKMHTQFSTVTIIICVVGPRDEGIVQVT